MTIVEITGNQKGVMDIKIGPIQSQEIDHKEITIIIIKIPTEKIIDKEILAVQVETTTKEEDMMSTEDQGQDQTLGIQEGMKGNQIKIVITNMRVIMLTGKDSLQDLINNMIENTREVHLDIIFQNIMSLNMQKTTMMTIISKTSKIKVFKMKKKE